METSKRHHYIPQFLIKNFSDDDNKLWVYNKEEKRILKSKQSPKAIFFDWERNLFDINGTPGDNIEKMYRDVDDLLAKTLEKILSTLTMTGREQTLMLFLVSLMKWRIPKVDDNFYDLVKGVPIENLGFAFRHIDPATKISTDEINRINDLEIIKETKRLLLPIQPLINEETVSEIHKNCFLVSHDGYPALLGDCPIIESQNSDFKMLEDFIFPLSSKETFICKRGAEKSILSPLFYIQKDLTIFHLSKKYVACKSREHLENIVNIYTKLEIENKTHLLTKYVFEFIK
ncbi:DUF4238 domain-containing protein [Flavobacterium sangjuense]|uniref:DUF4238 domain-containing protein n=1 Tax=Flavobacterium sangjuense TaxID=2518177 RepID=A0A4P7PVP3_9FLAO|nr:DUF4238 domain-containing protein [Flavobacterium sangjuense]QBZ98866.1 hypothetical protein GS03_02378 [Flavobacterium sangjuense]